MSMARSRRPADDWDDRDPDPMDRGTGRRAAGSLPIRIAELAMRNPVTTGGLVVSVLMVGVTVANAIANQPVRHPHPLFATRTLARGDGVATPPAGRPAPAHTPAPDATPASLPASTSGIPRALPRPKPVSALEEDAVRELQVVLAERGFYTGSIDGVVGPATAEAIRACERRLGTTPTGEPSELLLAALRAAPNVVAETAEPVPQPPVKPAPPQTRPAPARAAVVEKVPSPPPARSMRLATVDAVAHPVPREEMEYAEVQIPVFTGAIRRAAREPLAPGGDEKLQKLQRALIGAGYGPLKADGRWDDHSNSAVRRYEADRGWPVTGRPSERLVWDLMSKAAPLRR
jgi:peptidoglycan hydrolase-like protein with peptidoglycan-binding domain